MISLTLVLMLRLVPYVVVAVRASRKGYKWLAFFAIYLIITAVLNLIFQFDQNVRGLMSSGGAILLLLHVLDVSPRVSK